MQQRVDPFIPVHNRFAGYTQRRPIIRRPVQSTDSWQSQVFRSKPTQRLALDGVVTARQPERPPVTTTAPRTITPTQPVTYQPVRQPAVAAPIVLPYRRLHLPGLALIIGTILGCGLLPSLVAGEIAIGLYALFAIVRGISSRTTFLIALAAMLAIAVVFSLQANSSFGEHFAVYAFLLLTIGTLSLGLEVRRGDTQ